MSVHSWSGTVACLLVLCLTAGCDASQQQQQPVALLGVTTDELPSFISHAVQAELQPIISRLEARVEDLDRRLEARLEDLDRKIETQEGAIESKLLLTDSQLLALDNKLFILDSRMDKLTVQLWNSFQQSQPNRISSKFDSQQVRLDEISTELDNQTSRLQTLYTRQDGQESRVVGLATHLDRLQSQLAALANSTTGVQSRQDGLTNSTTGVQFRVDGAANETAGQQPQADDAASRPDQAEGIVQPRDCSEMPPGTTSGVHPVWPDRSQDPVQAFCQEDSDGGKTWTVFQRRDDIQPRQDFFLGWDAYKRGFGNLTGEFWWGLEHLHKMTATQDRQYELMVDLEAFDGAKRFTSYDNFQISDEEDGYRLSACGYTGGGRDGLVLSVNRRFSTRDKDNDDEPGVSCAERHQGAWWYGYCGYSSLNGRYVVNGRGVQTGIWWDSWRVRESMKKVQMKIRPRPPTEPAVCPDPAQTVHHHGDLGPSIAGYEDSAMFWGEEEGDDYYWRR